MYKVVLIDDEAIIVEGLKKVVDWERFNCEVVDVAYSARQGSEAICRTKPDILITDIKMPDMDALTMLAGLRSEFPDMQITVLTGYRDFEYAQEAVRLGVVRLLLKPSKMEEIKEALQAMVSKLESEDGDAGLPEDEQIEQGASSYIVRQALDYLETHYTEKLSLQDVAEHCYVSQWHLSKLLNKHTNKTFYGLLNDIRIKKACNLLKDPSLLISDVGEMVGYLDTGHFSRVFKKIEGVSANVYRNRLKENKS